MKFQAFGETSELNQNSNFIYANSFSFNILKLMGKDSRFLDMNQSDIINMSLSLLMTCIMQYNNPRMAKHFKKVLSDYDEFKEYLLLLMMDGRMENKTLIAELEELESIYNKFNGDDE